MIRLVRINRTRFNWNQGLLRQIDTFLCIPLLGIVWKLWTRDRDDDTQPTVRSKIEHQGGQ